MPQKKLKLLAWMDSPLAVTGFGVVAKNILGRIYDTGAFDVACIGINHLDEYVEKTWVSREDDVPYRVFIGRDMAPDANGGVTFGDGMGRNKTIQMLARGDADVFFAMRDLWDMNFRGAPGPAGNATYFPFHIQALKENGRNFRVLSHFPLEYRLHPEWTPFLDVVDYGYCFTASGMEQLSPWSRTVRFAPQGADPLVFRPLGKSGWGAATIDVAVDGSFVRREVEIRNAMDFRIRKMRLLNPDCFLVVNVNRNQPRKDIRSTCVAFRKLLELVGEPAPGAKRPVLWLHMRSDDNFGDAAKVAQEEGLVVGKDVVFPPNFSVGVGWSNAELNMLYNAADIFVSTSFAEGFGLTNVEAGMAGCPTLVPGHTGFLQTMHHLGMPYVKTLPPIMRPDFAPSAVTPTDTDDLAARLFAHYKDQTPLRRAVEEHLEDFRITFSWDQIFARYWVPCLETIQADIFNTQKRVEKNSSRYLYVCDEAFGDVLGSTKAVAALKELHPEVPIDYMTKPRFQDVLVGNPNVDRILPWDLNKLYDYPANQVFYPHKAVRVSNWSTGFTHLMNLQPEMIGLSAAHPAEIVPAPFDLKDEAGATVLPADVQGLAWIVTVHTTSGGVKMIDPGKWKFIVDQLKEKRENVVVVQVGGPNDFRIEGTVDARGTSFREMAFIQRHAVCHVGIDSGPAHCAAASGCPSIVFWGWTGVGVCAPERYAINIVPHYPTACPILGACYGNVHCGVDPSKPESAVSAPCVRSLDPSIAVQLLLEATEAQTPEEARERLLERSKVSRVVYRIPTPPGPPIGA